jgi:hypothetical protein
VIDGDGRLDIVRSRLIGNQAAGAFLWGGTANVVSSQFIDSGGLLHYGGALRFVNSTQYVARGRLGPSDTNTIGLGSDAVFEASSISGYSYGCPYCPTDTDALVFRVTGGNVRLRSTAVGNTAERPETSPLVRVMNGGSLTADALTWMQPTALQDGAALIALTGQASLLTAPPGLLENGNQLIDYYPAPVAPLLGTAGTPGVLIDAVPDANGANQLIDPITSTPLTTDVFGNPRVDGNGRRNIGAIQTSLAPYLQIAAIGDGAVSLAWTRPADPVSGAITGYDIRFRRVGDVSWGAPRRVTGPGVLTSVITGLTNGVQYEFEVTGVNDAGEGPASNVVSGKPLGEVGAPAATVTPTEGQANLTWSPPGDWGGHGATTDYFVVYNLAGQRNAPTQVQVNGTSTVIGGLTNGAQYEFCVYARAADSTDGGCVPVGAAIPAAQSTTTTAPAPAPDQSGSALPRTGVTTRPQVAFAAVILLMGMLLVFAARRRA